MPDHSAETPLAKATLQRVPDVVYCLGHGTVHDNTLNPYEEGSPSTCFNGETGVSKAMVHRTVYVRLRKGDWPEPTDG